MAILLHDTGHGPFSHALEHSIVRNISHEDISLAVMQNLNFQFHGKLEHAIQIFTGTCRRPFFHQLVSGQLDVDRLDYLTRDSFFTGVSEGVIGTERIIKMMNVFNNELVIEEKGIYSIEKFLISRQLMYWQVYLHKTVIAAEILLIKVLQRAHGLCMAGEHLDCAPPLDLFLRKIISREEFLGSTSYIEQYCNLDDFDIISSIKTWMNHKDKVLSDLSKRVIHRKLFRTILTDLPFSKEQLQLIQKKASVYFDVPFDDAAYYFDSGKISAQAYDPSHNPIKIHFRDGSVKDIALASSTINLGLISGQKTKYYLAIPKEISDDVQTIITQKE
jgi:HD superfamily phosphohydrolase